MSQKMSFLAFLLSKFFVTLMAFKWSFVQVSLLMEFQIFHADELLKTLVTFKRPVITVK